MAVFALCSRARSDCASWLQAHRPPSGRVAADGVAEGENEPAKFWISTLPEGVFFRRLVDVAKLRWRIERDYQELKQEFGLGHFEGRRWRGFHRHAALCVAAYGFLICERETNFPSGSRSRHAVAGTCRIRRLRYRGSAAPTRAAHRKLDRVHAPTAYRVLSSEPCRDVHAATLRS